MNYYRKDWILFQEIANEGGKIPEGFLPVNAKEMNPDENKHVPFIVKTEKGYKVTSGKNEMHPIDAEHHLMFIDLYVDNQTFRINFKNGDVPSHEFIVEEGKEVVAYAFCNLHGMFKYTFK